MYQATSAKLDGAGKLQYLAGDVLHLLNVKKDRNLLFETKWRVMEGHKDKNIKQHRYTVLLVKTPKITADEDDLLKMRFQTGDIVLHHPRKMGSMVAKVARAYVEKGRGTYDIIDELGSSWEVIDADLEGSREVWFPVRD